MAVNIMQSQQWKARLKNTLQVSASSNPTKFKLCTHQKYPHTHKKKWFSDFEGGDCAFAVEEYHHKQGPTFYFKASYVSTWAGPNLRSGQIWCGLLGLHGPSEPDLDQKFDLIIAPNADVCPPLFWTAAVYSPQHADDVQRNVSHI